MRTILSRGFFHGTSKIATLDKTHVWNVAIQTILKNLRKKNICYIDCDIWIQDYTHNYRRFPISTFWNTLEKIFHISFKDSEKIYVNCPSFIRLCLPLCNCQENRIILRKCVVKQIAIHRKCFTINHTLFLFNSSFSFHQW